MAKRIRVAEALIDRLSTEDRWLSVAVLSEWVAVDHGWAASYVRLALRRLVAEGRIQLRELPADGEPMVRCSRT